jgi:hypothetical protein
VKEESFFDSPLPSATHLIIFSKAFYYGLLLFTSKGDETRIRQQYKKIRATRKKEAGKKEK